MSRARTGGVVVILVLLASSTPAAGHADDYTPSRWNVGNLTWSITGSFPPNAPFPSRDRVRDGRSNWPVRPSIVINETALNWPWNSCGSYAFGANGIHYGTLFDGQHGRYAVTCNAVSGGVIQNSQTIFDSDETWWPYDSQPVPGTHLDMESVSTHEWGHALGHKHWNTAPNPQDASVCSSPNPRHTMCTGQNLYGTSDKRTPEAHDLHEMDESY